MQTNPWLPPVAAIKLLFVVHTLFVQVIVDTANQYDPDEVPGCLDWQLFK